MLFERVILSCLLAGAVTARVLQATLLGNILATRTAANSPEREVAATAAAAPSPTQLGLISTCNAYYRVQRGDYCATVVDKFYGLTLKEFYAWNPAVKSDCSELLDGYYVCVGISDTPPTAAHPTAASGLQARAEAIPSPIESGTASNCDNYYRVITDDTCIGVAYQHSITLSQFYSWNPAVGSNCQVLLAGYYVCVGVSDTITTSPPTSTTATSPPPPTNAPEPTQPGITSDCTEYYEAKSGDTCVSIVQKYEAQGSFITLSAFERWNPAVGRDCVSLLAGYFYCVATTKMHH